MKFVFRRKALDDLEWFERYYTEIFPDGSSRAEKQYFKAKETIKEFPEIGMPARNRNEREYVIPGIPFSVLYRITQKHIVIVRILDHRSNRQ